VLTNRDLEVIGKYLQVGLTPVIIANGIRLGETGRRWKACAQDLLAEESAKNGAATGMSLDTEAYSQVPTQRASLRRAGSSPYGRSKNAAFNASKTWIKVKALTRQHVSLSPAADDLAVITPSTSGLLRAVIFQNQMRKPSIGNQREKGSSAAYSTKVARRARIRIRLNPSSAQLSFFLRLENH
jgi:hypothetical protein